MNITKSLRLSAGVLAMALIALGCGAEDSQQGAAAATDELPTLSDKPETATDPSSENEPPRGELSDADRDEAFAEYSDCLAELGVMVDFSMSEGATIEREVDEDRERKIITEEDAEAAMAECDPLLDSAFGSVDQTPEEEAEFADSMLVMEKCLESAGISVEVDGHRITPDPNDPNFDVAAMHETMKECEAEAGFSEPEDGDGS